MALLPRWNKWQPGADAHFSEQTWLTSSCRNRQDRRNRTRRLPMRVCVYGAGAIGGHLAVRLARGGAEVSVVARGPHLAAIRRDGLTVHASDGQFNVRVLASDDPKALGPQDAVLVTVKAPALPAVADGIGPLLK